MKNFLFCLVALLVFSFTLSATNILIVNDDGICSNVLSFAEGLAESHTVTLVVPSKNESGSGFYIRPFEKSFKAIEKVHGKIKVWQLNGNPAECVLFGVNYLMKNNPPDIILSGPNKGPNLAAIWVHSGTIGAAYYASLLGFPSFALSAAIDFKDISRITSFTKKIIKENIHQQLPYGTYLTFSFPQNMQLAMKVTKCAKYPIFCSSDFEKSTADPLLWQLDTKKIGEDEYRYIPTPTHTYSSVDSDIAAYDQGIIAVKIMAAGPFFPSEKEIEKIEKALESIAP